MTVIVVISKDPDYQLYVNSLSNGTPHRTGCFHTDFFGSFCGILACSMRARKESLKQLTGVRRPPALFSKSLSD